MESKLTVHKKFEVMKRLREKYQKTLQVNHLCQLAGVSRSGYYHYLQTSSETSIKSQQDQSDYALILKA